MFSIKPFNYVRTFNTRSYSFLNPKSLIQNPSKICSGIERTLFGNLKDTAFLYSYDAVKNTSIFNPYEPLQSIDFHKKNYKGEPMRTILAFSGSSAAFNIENLHDTGGPDTGNNNPSALTKEGVREVAGFPKRLSFAMGGRGVHKYVQFITVNYGSFERNRLKLRMTNFFPESYVSSEARSFSEKLLPFFSTEHKITWDGSILGKRRPLDKVIRDVNNVTIIAQSYGGSFVRQMTTAMKQHLRDLRYNEKEISTILSNFVFIGFGPVTNALYDDKCPLNSVYFANPSDIRSAKNIYNFKSLVPKEIHEGKKLAITGLNHNSTIVWNSFTNYCSFEFIKDCNGKKERVYDAERHMLPFYLTLSRVLEDGTIPLDHVPFVTLARCVMRNATERTQFSTMEELLAYNPKILRNEVDEKLRESEFPTLQKTRESSEEIIHDAIERAKIEREIEIGA